MAWAWKPPGDSRLASLLLDTMKSLESYLKSSEKYLPTQARVATTDNTVTTLFTAIIPVDHTVVVSGHVVARRTGGSSGSANDGAGYVVEFCAKNTSGTAALIGSGTVTALGESQAGWDVTLSASSGTIRVRVTGASNNNISWRWSGRSLSVMNEE
jgi:hypothetical protein